MSIPEGYIELKFGPRWKYISVSRSFIQNFIAVSVADQAKASSIAMATSELLENAVKYASGDETNVKVNVYPENERISVRVQNEAHPDAIKELQVIFNKISEGDPLEAYVSAMKEAAVRTDGKSQLGLARIRYETGAKVDLSVTDNKIVTISIDVG